MDALDVLLIPSLSQEAIDIVFGTLMGDASLSFSRNPDLAKIFTATCIYDLGLMHKDIVQMVVAVISQFVVGSTAMYNHYDKRSNKSTVSFRYATERSALFLPFVHMFYTVNASGGIVKQLPMHFAQMLTPRALAYWIMDDGQVVKRGGVTLCTDNFTQVEVNTMADVLRDKFGLKCTIHNKNVVKGYYRIYISGTSLPQLRELVLPYMADSMLYKIY